MKIFIVSCLLISAVSGSVAAEPASQLPSLAGNPEANYWSGLSVGSSIFTVFRKGSKPLIGGSGTVAYDKKLENNFTIGVGASTGFAPYSVANSPLKGYNFGTTDVKLGYEMGKLHPWVSTGLVFAKGNSFSSYSGPGDSINGLFGGPGKMAVSTSVGAGFDYQVTNNLSVSLGMHVGNSPLSLFSR